MAEIHRTMTSGGMFKVLFANPSVTAADVTAVVAMVATDLAVVLVQWVGM